MNLFVYTPTSKIKSGKFSPSRFGFTTTNLESLRGGEPDENADIIWSIFNGETGPRRDIVVFNAGAGIKVGGKTTSLRDGIKLAEESIDSGSAKYILESLAAEK